MLQYPRASLPIDRLFTSEYKILETGPSASYMTTDVTSAITLYDGASDLTRRIRILRGNMTPQAKGSDSPYGALPYLLASTTVVEPDKVCRISC